MARVYLIEDVGRATYFGTKKAARVAVYPDEDHGRIRTLDAADECNALAVHVRVLERQIGDLTRALRGLVGVAPPGTLEDTPEGRDALGLMREIDPDFVDFVGSRGPRGASGPGVGPDGVRNKDKIVELS